MAITAGARAQGAQAAVQRIELGARLGQAADGEVQLEDVHGRRGSLRRFVPAERPVFLTLNYLSCRALCDTQLRGLAGALKAVRGEAGRDYGLLTVSIDPSDPRKALADKERELERALGGRGQWTLLRGDGASIEALARSVGFAYAYEPRTRQYAHAPLLIVLTPEGRVSGYLDGVAYRPRDLQLALIEAKRGKMTSRLESVLLACFERNEITGRYSLAVLRLVQAGGAATLFALVGFVLWSGRVRARRDGSGRP